MPVDRRLPWNSQKTAWSWNCNPRVCAKAFGVEVLWHLLQKSSTVIA